MLDTWSDDSEPAIPLVEAPAEPMPPAPPPTVEPARGEPTLQPLVERALDRELARRRTLQPNAQLGIAADADAGAIEEAYARLRRQYDSPAFATYGEAATMAAHAIAELLEDAYRRMKSAAPVALADQPTAKLVAPASRDERLRALATLHNAIARRLREAAEHRRAGRLHDAIRLLEAVMRLDHRNQAAKAALDELRRLVFVPKKKNLLERLRERVGL